MLRVKVVIEFEGEQKSEYALMQQLAQRLRPQTEKTIVEQQQNVTLHFGDEKCHVLVVPSQYVLPTIDRGTFKSELRLIGWVRPLE